MAGVEDGRRDRDRQRQRRRALMSHPLRRRIGRLLVDGREAGADEIAAELNESAERVAYHLLLLFRRDVLKAVPKCRPAPPCFRWSPPVSYTHLRAHETD